MQRLIYHPFVDHSGPGQLVRYLFEDCTLDCERRELRRGETVVPLEPQVFDLVELLLHNRDRVVSKDEIISAIWRGRAVSDAALTTRLNAARQAIGDDGKAQRLVRTLRRKGLRFVGPAREEYKTKAAAEAQSAALGRSLAWAIRGAPALVALSFVVLGGQTAAGQAAEGLSDEIVSALSCYGWFVVAALGTLGAQTPPLQQMQAGGRFGALYRLEGRVRHVGNRIRVAARLLDAAAGGCCLWAKRYERSTADVFALRDELAGKIASAVAETLFAAEALRTKAASPESFSI